MLRTVHPRAIDRRVCIRACYIPAEVPLTQGDGIQFGASEGASNPLGTSTSVRRRREMKAEEEKRMRHSPAPDHHDAPDQRRRLPRRVRPSSNSSALGAAVGTASAPASRSVLSCDTTLGWAVQVQEQREPSMKAHASACGWNTPSDGYLRRQLWYSA